MDDLIYNQTKIPKSKCRYGFRSSAATGCGWIATYNARRLMGDRAEPEKLIRYFEKQFPLIHGNFGTSFWGPYLYFRKWGFPVKLTAKRSRFDTLAREGDVCILFYRWRRGWRFGAHFVALKYRDNGFVGYNTFATSDGPDAYGESLDAWLRKQRYFHPLLTVILRKRI